LQSSVNLHDLRPIGNIVDFAPAFPDAAHSDTLFQTQRITGQKRYPGNNLLSLPSAVMGVVPALPGSDAKYLAVVMHFGERLGGGFGFLGGPRAYDDGKCGFAVICQSGARRVRRRIEMARRSSIKSKLSAENQRWRCVK